jgi:small subunit ribosomal protein S6
MTSYETIFIVRPDIEEDDLNKVIGRVEDVLKSNEATIVESQVWGKKRLAYEVRKYTEGIYVKVNFDAPPAIVKKLQDHFRLNEDVIRDIVVREERRQTDPARPDHESATAVQEIEEAEEDTELEDDED